MKKILLLPIAGLLAYLSLSSNSSGIVNQTTAGCGGGSCHGGSANSATVITFASNIPASGWVPGTSYLIQVQVSNPNQSHAGFNAKVSNGSLAAGLGMTLQGTTDQITHTAPKAFGTGPWSFGWTAPAASSTATSMTITVAGNAVNNNGNNSGDVWNFGSTTFQRATAGGGPSTPTLTATGSTTVCGNAPFPTLTASSSGATSYSWFNGATQIPGVTTATYTPTTAGSYTATATNSSGTSSASSTVAITTSALPSATFTATNTSGSTYNFAYATGGLAYLWTFGEGSATSTGQNPSYTYTTGGAKTVKLRVTNGAGCRDSTTQTLNVTLGVGSIAGVSGFSYGPNPASGTLMLRAGNTPTTVRLLDATGRLVSTLRSREEKQSETAVSFSQLPAGIYFLEVATDNARGVDKLIVR